MFENLNASMVQRTYVPNHAKVRAGRSNRCQEMAVCLCFKTAVVRHL